MANYMIAKNDPCPALQWEGDQSVCGLASKFPAYIMGFGAGCCIKARCIKDGITYDFASLQANIKIKLAQSAKERKGEK